MFPKDIDFSEQVYLEKPLNKFLPYLSIDGIEVTQAIQYYKAHRHLTDPNDRGLDNSVTLVANKPAYIRVYLRTRVNTPLVYQGSPVFPSEIHDVTGQVVVARRRFGNLYNQAVVLNPLPPGKVTAHYTMNYAQERGSIANTLNFLIPADEMCGDLRLKVTVTNPNNYLDEATIYIIVTLRQTLRLRGIFVGYNGPTSLSPNAPTITLNAPTINDLETTSALTLRLYPVQSDAVYGNAGTITWTLPLTDSATQPGSCSPNWNALIAAVRAQQVLDGNRTDVLYYGLLPVGIPMGAIIGCSGGGTSTGSNGDQDTMAHELGHHCTLPHAPCGGVGNVPWFPTYEPYTTASIGEYGLDIDNGAVLSPVNHKDLMSYCGPEWISLYNYGRLVNNARLHPEIVCQDDILIWDKLKRYKKYKFKFPPPPEAVWPPIPDPETILKRDMNELEPIKVISITGILHPEDRIEITSLLRLEAVPYVVGGTKTDIIAELLDEKGETVTQSYLYEVPTCGSTGCGCQEGSPDVGVRPAVFQAFLADIASGYLFQIRRGEEVLWRREAPQQRPEIEDFRLEVSEKGLTVSWKIDAAVEDPECGLQWSVDNGRTWSALAGGLRGNQARFEFSQLPNREFLLRLLVSDGFFTVASDPKILDDLGFVPTPSILSPYEDQLLISGNIMRCRGVITSTTGEPVQVEEADWILDGESRVAAGLDAFIDAPPEGEHKLTLLIHFGKYSVEKTVVFYTVAIPKE